MTPFHFPPTDVTFLWFALLYFMNFMHYVCIPKHVNESTLEEAQTQGELQSGSPSGDAVSVCSGRTCPLPAARPTAVA